MIAFKTQLKTAIIIMIIIIILIIIIVIIFNDNNKLKLENTEIYGHDNTKTILCKCSRQCRRRQVNKFSWLCMLLLTLLDMFFFSDEPKSIGLYLLNAGHKQVHISVIISIIMSSYFFTVSIHSKLCVCSTIS